MARSVGVFSHAAEIFDRDFTILRRLHHVVEMLFPQRTSQQKNILIVILDQKYGGLGFRHASVVWGGLAVRVGLIRKRAGEGTSIFTPRLEGRFQRNER
jgi:hypothetical protein